MVSYSRASPADRLPCTREKWQVPELQLPIYGHRAIGDFAQHRLSSRRHHIGVGEVQGGNPMAAQGPMVSPPPPGEPVPEAMSNQATARAPSRPFPRPAKARKPLRPPEQHVVQTDPHRTALPLSEDDIEMLREPAYKAQTFRLTQTEIDWIRDTAYRLSKEIRRGKVAQADVLRIALKLFADMLASKKGDLLAILERIK